MTSEEIQATCLEIIETAPIVYVTSIADDGYPHTRAMFNLRNREMFPRQIPLFAGHEADFLIYLSTNTSSHKLQQMRDNPKVSLYYCHPSQFKGVMLLGDIEIVDSSELRQALWNEGWERYYPSGPDDPDHTALRLRPKSAEGWSNARRFEFQCADCEAA
ncbi:MAG: pyridoxamine 5'-phosphate oxidase family protein [Chloroflexota bacterium]